MPSRKKSRLRKRSDQYRTEFIAWCDDCGQQVRHLPYLIRDNAITLADYHTRKTGHVHTRIKEELLVLDPGGRRP